MRPLGQRKIRHKVPGHGAEEREAERQNPDLPHARRLPCDDCEAMATWQGPGTMGAYCDACVSRGTCSCVDDPSLPCVDYMYSADGFEL